MTLYRGPGGTGSATSDADTTLYQDFLNQTIAARDAALQAEINAELAETNAETAETNAETAETNAETAATNAASSASAAATSASNASSSASSASTSASAASTSATAAASSASSASSSASAASTSATSASTSATNAANSATNAANSATSASNSASTATTQASNAASSASAAATSASSAATSATNASNSASSAATSATNAASSATAAAASATAAAASAASIDPDTLVKLTGDQTIGGTKTFTSTISGSITGNAGTVTNGVYTTGDQTIAGTKTFSSNPVLSAGTVNGLAFLNASKVLTTGSALTFNGTSFGVPNIDLNNGGVQYFYSSGFGSYFALTNNANALTFGYNGSEQMRLTSTGLGIGTSSPTAKLHVAGGGLLGTNSTNPIAFTGSSGDNAGIGSYNANTDMNIYAAGTGKIKFRAGAVWSSAGVLTAIGPDLATLDSSGNLGLGVTPSAWTSTFKAIQVGSRSSFYQDSGASAAVGNNIYNDGTNRYIASAPASIYLQESGSHIWFRAPSGTAGNAISFTQAMTLDASGNLMLGTTTQQGRLHVSVNGVAARFTRTNNTDQFIEVTGGDGAGVSSINANYTLALQTGGTERARIDSSGNLLVGTTSGGKRLNVAGSNNVDLTYTNNDGGYTWNSGPLGTGLSGRFNWYYANTTSDRMFLTTAGALFNSTGTYGTISDVSLKENIVDATPKLADLMRVRVRNYNMKADPEKRKVIGVVAQELEEVFPGLIEETVNRVALENGTFEENSVKAVKYSVLTTILVKAIQEQQALIQTLTARVAALESN